MIQYFQFLLAKQHYSGTPERIGMWGTGPKQVLQDLDFHNYFELSTRFYYSVSTKILAFPASLLVHKNKKWFKRIQLLKYVEYKNYRDKKMFILRPHNCFWSSLYLASDYNCLTKCFTNQFRIWSQHWIPEISFDQFTFVLTDKTWSRGKKWFSIC